MPEHYEAVVTLSGDLHARLAASLAITAAKFLSSIALLVGGSRADECLRPKCKLASDWDA
jgi:hypothetical protein